MERRRLEAELGQEHFCPPTEQFCPGNFPPGGGIEAIVITNNPLIFGRPIFINIFNNTISSQNSSSSLESKSFLQVWDWCCRLLVVLITPCS